MMSLSQGDRLGRYEILGPIGAGGMGEVWRALDTELDRQVAVKILPESFASDENRLERFQREAKALAALTHPNLLDIYDVGATDGIHYAVTELLEGDTLRERITPTGLPWQKVTAIGAAVADGLAAAHGRGIIHRDIKPENLFLTADGRVKILDFGLASVHEEASPDARTATITEAGTVMGTPGYMSPEQVKGQPADTRSDIFSLGCVIYEMASGHRAFGGDTGAEVIAAILKEEPPQLSSSGAAVPVDLERAVHRCLEKRPEARFQSAADLAYSLKSVGHSGIAPVMATPGSGTGDHHRRRSSLCRRSARRPSSSSSPRSSPGGCSSGQRPGADRALPSTLDPNRIAVVPFTNRTGDASLDNLAALTANRLEQGLAELDEIEVAPASVVSAASAGVEPAVLVREVARETDSGLVLTGVWDSVGTGLELQATLEDAEERTVVRAFDPIPASRDAPQDAIATLRDWTLMAVQDHFHPALAFGADDHFPKYEAYQEYRTWFQTMGSGRWQRAVELDPTFLRARFGPVYAHMVGGDPNAKEMLLAFAEDPGLTVRQTRIVGGLDAILDNNWNNCLAEFELVQNSGHDNWVIRMAVLQCALYANRPRLAVETYEHLGPPPFGIDVFSVITNRWAGDAYHLLGRYEDELAMTRHWKEVAPNTNTVFFEGRALAALGRLDEIGPVEAEARSSHSSCCSGGQFEYGTALELYVHGHKPEAQAMAARAVEWFESNLHPESALNLHLQYALALMFTGHLEVAQVLLEELSAANTNNPFIPKYLGICAVRLGNREAALDIASRMEEAEKEAENDGAWMYGRAVIAAQLGETRKALLLLQGLVSRGFSDYAFMHSDPYLEPLWDDPEFQEILRPKG